MSVAVDAPCASLLSLSYSSFNRTKSRTFLQKSPFGLSFRSHRLDFNFLTTIDKESGAQQPCILYLSIFYFFFDDSIRPTLVISLRVCWRIRPRVYYIAHQIHNQAGSGQSWGDSRFLTVFQWQFSFFVLLGHWLQCRVYCTNPKSME